MAEKTVTREELLALLEDANRKLASARELKKADAAAHKESITAIEKDISDILRDLRG